MFDNQQLIEHLEKLRRFALQLTGNVPDAEDLLHSTVLRAIEKKELFEKDSNLLGWMSKIMFNIFLSQYRHKAKFETKHDPEDFIAKEVVHATQETAMEASKVREALGHLPPDQRQILLMACAEGQKYKDIAKDLNIPIGTVRSRVARARSNLQVILDQPMAKRAMPGPARREVYAQVPAV